MELANSGKISNNDNQHTIEYEFNNGVLRRRIQEPSRWAAEALKTQERHMETKLEPIKRQTFEQPSLDRKSVV